MDEILFLYRGICEGHFLRTGRSLIPKAPGKFEYQAHWDEFKWGSGVTWGASERNAVIRHELDQLGFPTAGVSTSPWIERAKFYATRGHQDKTGYIFILNRSLFLKLGIREFKVTEYSNFPSVPEDDEVILVAKDGGAIPSEAILEVFKL